MANRATSTKTRPSTKTTKAASSNSRTTRKSTKKTTTKKPSPSTKSGEKEVTIDRRRGARRGENGSTESPTSAERPKLERRKKVNRRRQIDPTTCERDYSQDEIEFMSALDDYKRANGRMFPTCSEVLEVIRGLGYVKLSPAELAQQATDHESREPMNGFSGHPEEDDFSNDMAEMALAGEEAY